MPYRSIAGRPVRLLLIALLGACCAFALAGPSVVNAENSLEESTPEDGAELTAQPTEISATFENPIGAGTFVSVACDNNPFNGYGDYEVTNGNRTVTLPITQPISGDCVVSWTIGTPDGGEPDRLSHSFSAPAAAAAGTAETAGEGTEPEAAAEGAETSDGDDGEVLNASDVSSAPVWLGRVLSITGLSILFGSLVLIVAAWPEGPEYVLALRFLRSVWVLALVGTLIYVIALSAAVNGESFGGGISPGSWLDLFDAGWAGRAAIIRLVLVAACGWVVLKPERVIDPTTNMLALGLPALAVVTLGLSRTGGDWPALGVLASIVHVLAISVWFGGVVLLGRVVLAGPGEEDLVHAVRGFGRISNTAIIATVVSGLVELWRLVGGELFSTGHGRVLLLKTVGVAAMLFVGMTARQIARARLNRAGELSIKTADRLRRAFGTEAAIGLIVIALTGWMMSFEPGKVPSGAGDFPVSERVTNEALDVELLLSPGRIGVNEIQVILRRPESGVSGFVLRFFPPEGSAGTAFEQPIELTQAGVAESGDGGGVPFDVPGRWRVEINATGPEGQLQPTNITFDIRDADGDLAPIGNADLPSPPVTTSTTQATAPPTTPTESTEG